jgi:nitrogenase subunit NifH
MNWHAFTFVYQTNDALARIQETLQNKRRQNDVISIRELLPMSKIKTLPEKERDNEYKRLVKEILLLSQFSLLLDIENENLSKLLDTMNNMELMNDYFMCLITNLVRIN